MAASIASKVSPTRATRPPKLSMSETRGGSTRIFSSITNNPSEKFSLAFITKFENLQGFEKVAIDPVALFYVGFAS